MQNKSYTVTIHFDLNTVDCPGVWLCPKGKAFLKICLFGCADISKDVDPHFPLTIRERFIFEKDFRNVSSIYELHDKIGRSVISIELLQCPVGSPGCVTLAIFNSLLTDLLHPYSTCFAKPPDTTGIELLFTTCKLFPGVIAPKADVSVKVVVSDFHGDGGKPTVRRIPLSLRKGDRKRQKPVCHTKNGLNCGCFRKNLRQSGDQGNIVTAERRNDDVEPRGLASSKPGDSRPGFQGTAPVSEYSPKPEPHIQTDSTSAERIDAMERYPGGDTDVTPVEPSDTEEPSMEMPRKNAFLYRRKPRMTDRCEESLEGVDPKNVRIAPNLKMKYDSCVAQAVRQRKNKSGGLKSAAPQPGHVEIPCHGKCCKCEENAKKTQVDGVENENEVETFEMRRDNNPGRFPTIEETESFPLKSYYRTERVRKRDYESTTREKFRRERQEESRERMRSGRTQRYTQDDRSERRDDRSSRRGQEHERLRRQDQPPSSKSSEGNVDPNDIRVTQTRGESAGDQNDAQSRPHSSSHQGPKNDTRVKRPAVTKIPRPITKPNGRSENGHIHAVSTTKPSTEPQPRRLPPKPPSRRPTQPEEEDSSGGCDCNLCEQYQELYNPSVHPCPRFRPHEQGRTNGSNGRQKSPTRPCSKKLVQSRKYAQGLSTQPPRYDRERDREREECGLFTCDGPNDTQAVGEVNAIQKFYHGK